LCQYLLIFLKIYYYKPHHHETFGVEPGASDQQIRQAYREARLGTKRKTNLYENAAAPQMRGVVTMHFSLITDIYPFEKEVISWKKERRWERISDDIIE